jgi:hypothetical protein
MSSRNVEHRASGEGGGDLSQTGSVMRQTYSARGIVSVSLDT